jgi:hypothetical protein
VTTSYTPPGQRTRVRKEPGKKLPSENGLDTEAALAPPLSYDEVEHSVPDAVDHVAKVEAHIDVGRVLERAPGELGQYLWRVYGAGEPIRDVAADVGISRFKLSRAISAYIDPLRAAA